MTPNQAFQATLDSAPERIRMSPEIKDDGRKMRGQKNEESDDSGNDLGKSMTAGTSHGSVAEHHVRQKNMKPRYRTAIMVLVTLVIGYALGRGHALLTRGYFYEIRDKKVFEILKRHYTQNSIFRIHNPALKAFLNG